MVNIPGILGFSVPGVFSIVRSRQGAVTLPGGPTVLAIMGRGQRELALVESATGGGADGAPAQFDPRLEPDGRHFVLTRAPVVRGSVALYLNPKFDGTDMPLVEITDPDDGAAWAEEFGIRRVTQVDQVNGDTVVPPSELENHAVVGKSPSNTIVVQGFRPGTSGRLAKLQLWLAKVGAPIDDLVVKIWGADGNNQPTGVGTELAAVTILNVDIPAVAGWVDVEFDLEVPAQTADLTESKLYFFSLERTGVANFTQYFYVGKNENNSYGDKVTENTKDGDVTLWPLLTTYEEEDLLFRSFINKGNFGVSYDLYGIPFSPTVRGAGFVDEDRFGLDAYGGNDLGSGSFFATKYGRRYNITPVVGETERMHYYIDYDTGQIILDHALNAGDKLIAIFLAEGDLNEYELFFDLEDLYNKHGWPSVDNTISQAAYMASLNGAPVIGAIHAGTYKNSLGRFITDIYWADAFEALEKEEVDFVVPIAQRDIVGEVIMSRFGPEFYNLTGGPSDPGRFLQEVAGGGDEPGINIYPLACDGSGNPVRLEVYKNGILLLRGVDYTLQFVCAGSTQPTKIVFTTPLVDGDHVVANYRPDIDLCAAVQTVALQHCEFMSSVRQRRERMLFAGAYVGYGFDQVLDPQTGVAKVFGKSFRCVYFFPERIRTVITGETAYLDGQYLAACGAGFLAGTPYLPTPLTRKNLVGFDIEKDHKYSIDQLNLLGDDGLTVIEPLSSGGRVVYGITTVQSGNPVEEEPSVVRIRDYVAKSARKILEERFIGGVIDDQIVASIKLTTASVLESLLAQRIITQYANVTSKVDSIEPRQVNVGFDVAPVFPLNWIKIEFSIGVL